MAPSFSSVKLVRLLSFGGLCYFHIHHTHYLNLSNARISSGLIFCPRSNFQRIQEIYCSSFHIFPIFSLSYKCEELLASWDLHFVLFISLSLYLQTAFFLCSVVGNFYLHGSIEISLPSSLVSSVKVFFHIFPLTWTLVHKSQIICQLGWGMTEPGACVGINGRHMHINR